MQPALFYQTLPAGAVECRLCGHYCRLQPGQTGPCRVRHTIDRTLTTSAFGRPVLMAVEPIEKKYLFHAFPGMQTLSLGTAGCNMGCQYCINWRVSQREVTAEDDFVSPETVVAHALDRQVGCIAFTYTEPTIFVEYALDIARLAGDAGLGVVAKSNGLMTPAVLTAMVPRLDAINIDLKGWNSWRHNQVTGSPIEPVLANLKLAKKLGLWLEISTLIVPGLNDSPEDLEGIANFIATELGPETPWHLQRFFPNYRMLQQPATSQAVLRTAFAIGKQAGLHFIYNKELKRGALFQTRCPICQTIVLRREGYRLVENSMQEGHCSHCNETIAGVNLDQNFMAPTSKTEDFNA